MLSRNDDRKRVALETAALVASQRGLMEAIMIAVGHCVLLDLRIVLRSFLVATVSYCRYERKSPILSYAAIICCADPTHIER